MVYQLKKSEVGFVESQISLFKLVVLIVLFLCLDFVHVEVRFAEELGGFELLGLLDVHGAVLAGLGYSEID